MAYVMTSLDCNTQHSINQSFDMAWNVSYKPCILSIFSGYASHLGIKGQKKHDILTVALKAL